MYADDIILVAPSVCVLQKLLYKCEQELNWLGMTINVKKSCCIYELAHAVMQSALTSPQAAEGSYHGLKKFAIWAFILLSLAILKALCMSIRNRFFRSVNAILGKVGRVASQRSDTATCVF